MKKEIDIEIKVLTMKNGIARYNIYVNNFKMDYFELSHKTRTVSTNIVDSFIQRMFNFDDECIIYDNYDSYVKLITRFNLPSPKVKEKTIYNLQKGDEYHFLDMSGNVVTTYWSNHENDLIRLKLGNVYLTKKDATRALNEQLATERVIERIAELNDGWEPDWCDSSQVKYNICVDGECNQLYIHESYFVKILRNCFYLKSYTLVRQLIEELEEVIKLMLGIKDEN